MRSFDRRQLLHAFDIVSVLVSRDQKARYKSTAMGVVWAVVSPLLFLLIFYFLFAVIMPLGIRNYASHVMVGIVVWTWLQNSVSEAVTCILPGRLAWPSIRPKSAPSRQATLSSGSASA